MANWPPSGCRKTAHCIQGSPAAGPRLYPPRCSPWPEHRCTANFHCRDNGPRQRSLVGEHNLRSGDAAGDLRLVCQRGTVIYRDLSQGGKALPAEVTGVEAIAVQHHDLHGSPPIVPGAGPARRFPAVGTAPFPMLLNTILILYTKYGADAMGAHFFLPPDPHSFRFFTGEP